MLFWSRRYNRVKEVLQLGNVWGLLFFSTKGHDSILVGKPEKKPSTLCHQKWEQSWKRNMDNMGKFRGKLKSERARECQKMWFIESASFFSITRMHTRVMNPYYPKKGSPPPRGKERGNRRAFVQTKSFSTFSQKCRTEENRSGTRLRGKGEKASNGIKIMQFNLGWDTFKSRNQGDVRPKKK